jgi:hypothetical protein
MKLLDIIPYSAAQFVFVSDHYDIHLSGTCQYKGQLCYFKTSDDAYDDENDGRTETVCEIYQLSLLEKLSWRWQQKKFEWMVGYHWTYPQRDEGATFYYRKPIWFYKFLFKLFYRRW